MSPLLVLYISITQIEFFLDGLIALTELWEGQGARGGQGEKHLRDIVCLWFRLVEKVCLQVLVCPQDLFSEQLSVCLKYALLAVHTVLRRGRGPPANMSAKVYLFVLHLLVHAHDGVYAELCHVLLLGDKVCEVWGACGGLGRGAEGLGRGRPFVREHWHG